MAEQTTALADILNMLLHKNNLRPTDLSRKTKIPQPTIHRITNGICTNPHRATLQKMADYFELSLAQLRGDEPISGLNMHNMETIDGWSMVPLYDWQSLAHLQYAQSITNTYTDSKVNLKAFAVYLIGHEMAPNFPDKSLLIFDPDKQEGSFVLLRRASGVIQFRQLVIKNDEEYVIALNTSIDHIPERLDANDTIIAYLTQSRLDY